MNDPLGVTSTTTTAMTRTAAANACPVWLRLNLHFQPSNGQSNFYGFKVKKWRHIFASEWQKVYNRKWAILEDFGRLNC